jgi:hypothetical protein
MGNLFAVVVHAQQAVARYPSLERFCADAGYRGTFVLDVDEILGRGVDITEKTKPHEGEKLPWRWIVERGGSQCSDR